MDSNLLESLEKLKVALDNHPAVLKLAEIETRLNSNEEVMKLAYQKDLAYSAYEDATKYFSDGSSEVRKTQKKLHEAKLALDTHPLVKEYNSSYKEVRELYDMINEKLFSEFRSHK